ncbi:AMP-binding protein [Bacillus dakarensis]|uniref:AMP-binding protein n=1 Tax=Robertmurraya dakarensis TaxID=1926278 RepID=UPI00137B8F06|nr:AMP-binding protein [Bacillus dakarensis]
MSELVLKDLFNKALADNHDKIAISFKNEELTYEELNKLANQLAHGFLAKGISVEDPVAMIMSNCMEYVVTDIAIMKSGAVKVPLNNMLGETEIKYMLENSQSKAAIVGPEFYSIVEKIREQIPSLQIVVGLTEDVPDGFISWKEFLTGKSDTTPIVDVKPSNTATITYSGGTTGLSKGIVQTQKKLVMSLYCHLIELEIVSDDKILVMTPLPHSGGRFIQTGILKGATHFIYDKFDPIQAINAILEKQITITFMVPTMIYRLLDTIEEKQIDVSSHSLKMMSYAAAPIMEDRLKQGLEVFGPVFFQFYGQTECPNFITRLKKEDHSLDVCKVHRLRSCGKPSIMSEVRIVNEDGEEVNTGEQGEITVKSPFVMERYHQLPEKTAETIINGWLHTGDMGKVDEEGYVYIMDRKNDMIISGGMNVYSTEVENVIQQVPGVRQVAVIGIPHSDWGEQVIAFVIADSSNLPSEEAILQYCKQNLAKYKCPKEIKFVQEFPLTPYGKLDKKTLRKPFWQNAERSIN